MQVVPTSGNEKFIRMAMREPIAFEENGKEVAFMLSPADYYRLTKRNAESFKRFCDTVSDRAVERGLTEEILEQLLRDDS